MALLLLAAGAARLRPLVLAARHAHVHLSAQGLPARAPAPPASWRCGIRGSASAVPSPASCSPASSTRSTSCCWSRPIRAASISSSRCTRSSPRSACAPGCAPAARDDVAATFGGALFALSGYFVSQLVGSGTYAVGAAWIPWALSAPLSAVRVGVCVALMVLGGDPQAAWFAARARGRRGRDAPRAQARARRRRRRARARRRARRRAARPRARGRARRPPRRRAARRRRRTSRFRRCASSSSSGRTSFGPRYGADWLVHPLYDEGSGLGYEPWSAGIYVGLATPLLALAALLFGRDGRAVAISRSPPSPPSRSSSPSVATRPSSPPGSTSSPARACSAIPRSTSSSPRCAAARSPPRGLPLAVASPAARARRRRASRSSCSLLARALGRTTARDAFSPRASAASSTAPSPTSARTVAASAAPRAPHRRWSRSCRSRSSSLRRLSPRAATLALAAFVIADLFAQSVVAHRLRALGALSRDAAARRRRARRSPRRACSASTARSTSTLRLVAAAAGGPARHAAPRLRRRRRHRHARRLRQLPRRPRSGAVARAAPRSRCASWP